MISSTSAVDDVLYLGCGPGAVTHNTICRFRSFAGPPRCRGALLSTPFTFAYCLASAGVAVALICLQRSSNTTLPSGFNRRKMQSERASNTAKEAEVRRGLGRKYWPARAPYRAIERDA